MDQAILAVRFSMHFDTLSIGCQVLVVVLLDCLTCCPSLLLASELMVFGSVLGVAVSLCHFSMVFLCFLFLIVDSRDLLHVGAMGPVYPAMSLVEVEVEQGLVLLSWIVAADSRLLLGVIFPVLGSFLVSQSLQPVSFRTRVASWLASVRFALVVSFALPVVARFVALTTVSVAPFGLQIELLLMPARSVECVDLL